MQAEFGVERTDELSFSCGAALAAMYKLSPYVWTEDGTYRLLLRVVNVDQDPSKKVARVHAGRSADGLRFALDDDPVIAPSARPDDADSGGCEDPTVARSESSYFVYYSGWNERRREGTLLLAAGARLDALTKRGVALPSTAAVRNPKEATIVRAADGRWLLFFEFAADDRSRIGLAESSHVSGPWRLLPMPFTSRDDRWDAWHLSPGPVVETARGPVMFYNGATRDAHWRVGWARFDANYRGVAARSQDPLIEPGERRDRQDTDIAFAASAVAEDGRIGLYYSIADRYCMRASLTADPRSRQNG